MNILIVDDQPSARRILQSLLKTLTGISMFEADSLESARQELAARQIDVALIDIRLQSDSLNRDGQILVREINQHNRTLAIVVSSLSEMEEIREAMRNGAYDYIIKDALSKELIVPVIEKIRHHNQLQQELNELREKENRRKTADLVLGTSKMMSDLFSLIQKVAPSDKPVLVTGPTGSGKELVVRAIHQLGPNPEAPLLDVNCGAIPENLIESQLFGHEKGSFTGAVNRQPGYFSTVGGGTLFLDEIGEMPMGLQPGLLRVLETREFRPLGASSNHHFDGRIVAATNANLEKKTQDNTFRQDLLYRLNVFHIEVPALADHVEDIPALVIHFSRHQPRKLRFTEDALQSLKNADWPGNIRQLRNIVDRVALLTEDDPITPETLRPFILENSVNKTDILEAIAGTLLRLDFREGTDKLTVISNAIILKALKECGGNKTAAAKVLGVNRKVIERRQQKMDDDSD